MPLWPLAIMIPCVLLFVCGGVGWYVWRAVENAAAANEDELDEQRTEADESSGEPAVRRGDTTQTPTTPAEHATRPVVGDEYKFGEQVRVGDLLICIPEVQSSQFAGQHYGRFASIKMMMVVVSIQNTSKGKIAEWAGWQGKCEPTALR
jgi:hypothetical protein